METLKFKTNIKCSGCVATVTPYLNEAVGASNWQVDTENPDKLLVVNADISEEAVISAVQKAGYKAEEV
jgi:copper chaperone